MQRLAGAAVAVLVAAGAVVLTLPDKSAGGTTVEVRADPCAQGARVVAAAGLTNGLLMASKLGALADGGSAAFLDLLLDGGERVLLDAMPCVRRPAGTHGLPASGGAHSRGCAGCDVGSGLAAIFGGRGCRRRVRAGTMQRGLEMPQPVRWYGVATSALSTQGPAWRSHLPPPCCPAHMTSWAGGCAASPHPIRTARRWRRGSRVSADGAMGNQGMVGPVSHRPELDALRRF